MRLGSNSVLPANISRPDYDRTAQKAGIVHFGIGAFHRAHQAVYTEQVLASGDLAFSAGPGLPGYLSAWVPLAVRSTEGAAETAWARPLPDLGVDRGAPEPLKKRLALAQQMREFSIEPMKLPDNRSYRSHADLGRPAVVWNVVATPELSLKLKTWCFPVLGCVGYRGYFDRAEADALAGLGYGRREALWAVKGLDLRTGAETPLIAGARGREIQVQLPLMSLPVQVREDYRTTRLSLKAHPCSFFRPHLTSLGTVTAASLAGLKNGRRTGVGGLVLNRQRPSTANGVVFMTLEDETGASNIVIWKDVFTANRRTVMGASILAVHGQLQNLEGVVHLVAQRFTDLSHMTARLQDETSGPGPERLQPSRDFH